MNGVFTHFISRGDPEDAKKRLSYAAWFIHTFPASEFEKDEYLFYEYLCYSVDIEAIIKYDYFQIWIDTELRELLHRSNVRVEGCDGLRYEDPLSFETAVRTTTEVLQDDFKALEVMDSITDDFVVNIASYMKTRMAYRLTQALSSSFEMLNDTDDVLSTTDELYSTLSTIRHIYDVTQVQKLKNTDYLEDFAKDKLVSKCGLELIDNDSDGLFETQLLGVEAQPGTGKTRFVLGTYVYNALTEFHQNVAFYALEQRRAEVEAMLIAHHIYVMFGIFIVDKLIYHDQVPQEHKHYVEAARYDLFKSGKYGKFYCSDEPLYVDDLESTLALDDRLQGPFNLVAIDYMGMLMAKPRSYGRDLSTTEIIGIGYPAFKRYVRNNGKAGIAIGQFNREGIAAGKADKEITTEMAQGGIVVYRNTDYNIAISMNDTMHAQNKRRVSQPKVRSSAGFPPHILDVRLGVLLFKQAARKEA